MKSPTVSVIVTCYNYGKFLSGCLTSILRQTYPDFEVVLVNDGSTDDTDAVAAGFLADERVVYLNQQNRGQAIATNTGIGAARGHLIAFLDADDLWEPTKLEKQVPLFTRDSVGVVYSRMKFIDEQGVPLEREVTGRYFAPRSGYVTEALLFENFVPYSSAVVRKECLEKFQMFNPQYKNGLDWDLWLRISTQYEFRFVDECLLSYRVGHPGQLTSNQERSVGCAELIFDRFLQEYQGVVPQSAVARALAYSYCRRGSQLRRCDRKRSREYYLKALRQDPALVGAYLGLTKNLLGL